MTAMTMVLTSVLTVSPNNAASMMRMVPRTHYNNIKTSNHDSYNGDDDGGGDDHDSSDKAAADDDKIRHSRQARLQRRHQRQRRRPG